MRSSTPIYEQTDPRSDRGWLRMTAHLATEVRLAYTPSRRHHNSALSLQRRNTKTNNVASAPVRGSFVVAITNGMLSLAQMISGVQGRPNTVTICIACRDAQLIAYRGTPIGTLVKSPS